MNKYLNTNSLESSPPETRTNSKSRILSKYGAVVATRQGASAPNDAVGVAIPLSQGDDGAPVPTDITTKSLLSLGVCQVPSVYRLRTRWLCAIWRLALQTSTCYCWCLVWYPSKQTGDPSFRQELHSPPKGPSDTVVERATTPAAVGSIMGKPRAAAGMDISLCQRQSCPAGKLLTSCLATTPRSACRCQFGECATDDRPCRTATVLLCTIQILAARDWNPGASTGTSNLWAADV